MESSIRLSWWGGFKEKLAKFRKNNTTEIHNETKEWLKLAGEIAKKIGSKHLILLYRISDLDHPVNKIFVMPNEKVEEIAKPYQDNPEYKVSILHFK